METDPMVIDRVAAETIVELLSRRGLPRLQTNGPPPPSSFLGGYEVNIVDAGQLKRHMQRMRTCRQP